MFPAAFLIYNTKQLLVCSGVNKKFSKSGKFFCFFFLKVTFKTLVYSFYVVTSVINNYFLFDYLLIY